MRLDALSHSGEADNNMSDHIINLRSENPSLLVEFDLLPGTHARIGSSPDAEIFLPLAGLAEFVCKIGRTAEGKIYISEPDGENPRFHELPAALPLSPYQFVVFHPTSDKEKTSSATARLQVAQSQRGKAARRFIPAAIVAAVVIVLACLIVINQARTPAATSPKAQAATIDPEPAPAPPSPAAVEKPSQPTPPPVAEVKPVPKEPEQPTSKFDLEALAQRIAPAVFRLEVKDATGVLIGSGTAFAISADGLAVTNFHVVEHGESFTARTTQGAEFTVLGVAATDPAADLALVNLKASKLPFLELGESETLKIGAPIAVFGCPQGLSGTLSVGILSAKRTEPEIAGKNMPNGGRVIQITAPISGGSSGSPVIDQTGKVIGVAAAALAGPTTQNLNFVIPVEAVKKLRKDSLVGLAKKFLNIKPTGPSAQPKAPSPKQNPETAFLDDPETATFTKLADSGDWIQCVKLGRKLVDRHPQSSTAFLFFGYSLNEIGLNEQAERTFKSGLAISPENGALWQCLGSAYDAQKKTQEARECWKRSGGMDPERAETWRLLAVSFLRHSEYHDAVSPMENLRKLDRAEFDRLLAIYRSLRVHTQPLQAMLYHFDSMAEGETSSPPKAAPVPEAADASNAEQLARTLVAQFLGHGEEQDIQTELADYAATVEPYFDQGQKTKPAILKDLTAYRAQWPHRTLSLIAIESARRDEPNTLEATYRLRYSANDGKRNRSGTLVQGIRYTLTDGQWLVSGIQTLERVTE